MARWIDDIVSAMRNLGGYASYSDLYPEVARLRTQPLPQTWEAIIRGQIETHSSDSEAFKGRDLFYSVDGIGKGAWGLRDYAPKTPRAKDIEEAEPERISDYQKTYRVKQEVYRILRDTSLARSVKEWHGYRCQLCGDALELGDGRLYAEAHHLKPLGRPHNGPDVVNNIVCVCPNHHALLDYGTIYIHTEDLARHPAHAIDERFIFYHNNVIVPDTGA
ncbi:MAG: hypothetical protein RhofKO_12540 [Rhodothermales bacterium]